MMVKGYYNTPSTLGYQPVILFSELACALQEAGGYDRGTAFGYLSSSRGAYVGGSYVSFAGTSPLVGRRFG